MRSQIRLQWLPVARALREGARRDQWDQVGTDHAKVWGFVPRTLETTETSIYGILH